MYYEIREEWKIGGDKEYYFNIRQTLKEVRVFIIDWIETWKENAEENEYHFIGFNTDYRTYARCCIKSDYSRDLFRIKIIKRQGNKENCVALSLDSWNEDVDKSVE